MVPPGKRLEPCRFVDDSCASESAMHRGAARPDADALVHARRGSETPRGLRPHQASQTVRIRSVRGKCPIMAGFCPVLLDFGRG